MKCLVKTDYRWAVGYRLDVDTMHFVMVRNRDASDLDTAINVAAGTIEAQELTSIGYKQFIAYPLL